MPLLLALLLIGGKPHRSTVSGLQDEDSLTAVAREYQIPPIVMWVIAFKESGIHGNNKARGPGYVIPQIKEVLWIPNPTPAYRWDTSYVRVCREIGRFQILPCKAVEDSLHNFKIVQISWAWLSPHCKVKNLVNYSDNIRCGAAIIKWRFRKYHDWGLVIQHHNGSGPLARKYLKNAKELVGSIILKMIQRQSVPDSLVVSVAH